MHTLLQLLFLLTLCNIQISHIAYQIHKFLIMKRQLNCMESLNMLRFTDSEITT